MDTGSSLLPPGSCLQFFIAHRVQQSHRSSIFHRVLLTHALALSASQIVRKKKSQQIYTSMYALGGIRTHETVFFFFLTLLLSSFWTSRGHRCRPSSPRFLPSIFIAQRIQRSPCSSIFHPVLLTHVLALSASQFVHEKKSQRIHTSMHSGGFELTKLTFFFSHTLLSSFWTSRGHRCRPSSPRFLPSIFIAHRVQRSHCSSIFHGVFVANSCSRAFRKSISAQEKVPTNLYEYALAGARTHELDLYQARE